MNIYTTYNTLVRFACLLSPVCVHRFGGNYNNDPTLNSIPSR